MQRIKTRGLDEITFRLKQTIWNKTDRISYVLRNSRSVIPGLSLEVSGESTRFFVDPSKLENFSIRFKKYFSDCYSQVLSEADEVCKHRFHLLGYRDLSFDNGNGINWHLDPVNGKTAPITWWQDIDCFDSGMVGDPKVIWELNRHQHFVVLAKAYLLSGNKQYKKEFIGQLDSWFNSNPPKKGINWASSLELAFRSIAWIWAYHLFDGDRELPKDIRDQFKTFLILQAKHIENNLSTYFSPNTHLTGEALGLYYIGLFLRGYKGSDRWIRTGKEILLKELPKQVLPDGGYIERSLWYHRYTLEIYLHFYLLSRLNGIELREEVKNAIESLGEFLMYSSRADKTFPLMGDDDGGRLLPLDGYKGDDLRGIFSTLAVLFKRGDFKYLSESYQEETLWLLGPESKEIYDELDTCEPPVTSRGFEKTGYFFMRDGWSGSPNYLAFYCGPHGWLNCGHAHADLLSFQLDAGKQPLIIDPGTYTYTGDLRNFFRGAESHCVNMIDGFYPATPRGEFHWELTPRHELMEWITSPTYDYVAGCMKGTASWKQTREVFFIKPDLFLIVDTLEGTGTHSQETRFPLFGKQWHIKDGKCFFRNANTPCSIEFIGPNRPRLDLSDSWMSLYYGHKAASYTLLFSDEVQLPHKVGFFINLSGEDYRVEMSDEIRDTRFSIFSLKSNSEIFSYSPSPDVS